MNQAFVDAVRNAGGKNSYRLLLISGTPINPIITCSSDYGIPIDPFNKFGICFNYYLPVQFTLERDDEPWTFNISEQKIKITPSTQWGTKEDYEEMFINFENIKNIFRKRNSSDN